MTFVPSLVIVTLSILSIRPAEHLSPLSLCVTSVGTSGVPLSLSPRVSCGMTIISGGTVGDDATSEC